MYLNKLSSEQKILFIDLCIHASLSNNNFDQLEKDTIDQYCQEMNLPEPRYTTSKSKEEVMSELVKISSKEELKIILLEITALILSDNIYDDFEKEFMNELLVATNIEVSVLEAMITQINKFKEVYQNINSIVFG